MRRALLALIVLAGAIAAALFVRGAVAPEAVRERIEATLSAWAGTPLHLGGTVETHLLPTPGLRWSRVTLTDPSGTIVADADAIDVGLAVLPLLKGRSEMTGLAAHGASGRLRLADLPPTTALLARLAALPPIDLRFDGAGLAVEARDGAVERLDRLEGRLTRGDGGRLDLTLAGRLRGETIGLNLTLPTDPATSPRWRLAATGPGAEIEAGGTRGVDADHRFGGTVSIDATDPARFAAWTGIASIADLIRAPLRLDATLAAGAATTTLTDLRLSLADAAATGSLAISHGDGEPALSGTLAFDTLDFAGTTPLFGEGWKRISLDRRRLPVALDLRLSAKRLKTARLDVAKLAASLNLAEGRLNAEIGEAGLWGRTVSAVVVGDLDDAGLSGRLRAGAKDLPATELGALFAIEGIEAGTVGIGFEGETVCARLGDCIDAIAGRLRLSARALTVTGASPFGDVTRFHPIVVAPKAAARKAVWSQAEADIRLQGRDARIESLEMTSTDARFALRGVGDLSTGGVDLSGHAFFRNLRATPPGRPAEEIRIPLSVRGTLRKLEVTPAMPEAIPADPIAVPLAPIPIVPPIGAPTPR